MPGFLDDKVEAPFQGTGVGTTAGVTVTQAAPTDPADKYVVYAIQCSSDIVTGSVVTVESPAATILYRKRFTGAFTMSETFPAGLFAAEGQAVLVKISASTANCEAAIQGVRI